MQLMTNAMLTNSQIACCCQLIMSGNDITFLACVSSETHFTAHAPQGGAGWLPVCCVAAPHYEAMLTHSQIAVVDI
eukprot:2837303-Amphidinium_carterae.1